QTMSRMPWIIAFCGVLMTGCSGVSIGVNVMSGSAAGVIGMVLNILGIVLGLGLVGFAIAGKEGEGPSAGAYLREVRNRTYAPTRAPVRFQCPACGRDDSCRQEFQVPDSPADDKMPA